MEETKTIKCPQCGSTEIARESETTFHCNHCKAVFLAEKKPDTKVVINKTTIVKKYTDNNGDEGLPASVGVFEPAYDSVDFQIEAYLSLAKSLDTPPDIFQSDFELIEETESQFALFRLKNKVSYSATIGYYRKESYQEWDSSLKKYVTKTKTVTEWQPYSGQSEIENETCIRVKGDGSPNNFLLAKSFMEDKMVDVSQTGLSLSEIAVPSLSDKQDAKESGKYQAESKVKNNLPGDCYKDFHADTITEIQNFSVYVVPEYVQKFKYPKSESISQLRRFKASPASYTVNKPVYDQVSDDTAILKYKPMFGANWVDLSYKFGKNKTTEDTFFYKLMKQCNKNALLSFLMLLEVIICAMICGAAFGKNMPALIIIPLVFIAIAIIDRRIIFKYESGKINLRRQSYQRQKRKDVIEFFNSHNLMPLSEEKLDLVYDDDKNNEVIKNFDNIEKIKKIFDKVWKIGSPVAFGLIFILAVIISII